ncbi:hypothetical protein [Pseudonocardia sp. T1-2H]|uniref:hypothetical protein n=1 Tax=Pseudonocardia sp. T1-2H TaxID=3128899 RepID=UPI0031012B59
MTVAFNHTIIATRDQEAGARFLAEVLGLPAPTRFGPFSVVALPDGASLDYMAATRCIHSTTRSSSPKPTSTP